MLTDILNVKRNWKESNKDKECQQKWEKELFIEDLYNDFINFINDFIDFINNRQQFGISLDWRHSFFMYFEIYNLAIKNAK